MKPRPCTWADYESFKRRLRELNLTADQYERAVANWLREHNPQ